MLALCINLGSDETLYQVLTDSLADLCYQMLITQKTGVIILVKK